ncbi:hypothetical protein HYPBUDRAFT_243293 [Hyphopichia burtonii NRRL Y-1933]|uniref:FHA domain-containing protein n=1 Tax=Hyphopichia burtonii NRRL Y-1933 TaxID=984485 RepID=A0A1E4RDU4_9ASCO|nr:hypothetical protein HYPBUDRAFT_243293 [Hyphopichia burtonii NRRL Y-1933]ODV65438.1 hypothetical protein HYPBUDRAFT_243293 [Hyphopichia burtonii NRRL Y-1933]
MSGLSLGDDHPLTEKNSSNSESPNNNLKLNIMSESDRKSFEDEPDINNLNLDEEIDDLLLNKRKPLDEDIDPLNKSIAEDKNFKSNTASNTHSPNPIIEQHEHKLSDSQQNLRKSSSLIPITSEAALGNLKNDDNNENSKISAYARLDFENFTFFVQTLQVVLGRKSNDELLQSSHHAVDVHLSSKKAISRRHAKIFYNFGTQRFELSILGRNGAFVDDLFVEKGITVPLIDGTKIQVGDIPFLFVLPSIEPNENDESKLLSKPMNPTDAINLRSNLYSGSSSPPKSIRRKSSKLSRKPSISSDNLHSRKNSKVKLPRKLSDARRKSLASATNDEINEILNALGADSIDSIAEDNDEFIDAQIQAILEGHEKSNSNKNEFNNALKLALFNESAIEDEEDEIDKLVQQHNLEQGVTLDESILNDESKDRQNDHNNNNTNTNNDNNENDDINMDLSILNQEIATLAPLIDAHNHDLLKEKEDKKKKLELSKFKKSQNSKKSNKKQSGKDQTSPPLNSVSPPSVITSNNMNPLMGKPAPPRMGKPASIQPPANRLYGRPLTGKSSFGEESMSSNSLPVNYQNIPNQITQPPLVTNVPPPIVRPPPPRPLPPKLEVPVNTITTVHVVSSLIPAKAITVDPFKFELAPICVLKSLDEPNSTPKIPKKNKDMSILKLTAKTAHPTGEVPEQYKTKPNVAFPTMITSVLRAKAGDYGMTLPAIIEGIREMYPYYKYCPDGWQSAIIHNVELNKIYKKVSNYGQKSEWTWTMDNAYIEERERVRRKQQEMAAARAKAAAIKAEELKQRQKIEAQQTAISQNITARNVPAYTYNPNVRLPQSQFISQLQQKQASSLPVNGQKPKTIAELASEIRRDGVGSKAPLYFKPQTSTQGNKPGELPRPMSGSNSPAPTSAYSNSPGTHSKSPIGSGSQSPTTIKAQLAANRSQSPSQQSQPPVMNSDTKKSLAYLQKELFVLYKARKLSYNTATTTEIITKALATTIAQVNVIGARAGCGDNALSFLVEKAPQQVSKILDIALTKSIKEKQGTLSSRQSSRDGTPVPQGSPPASAPASALSPNDHTNQNTSIPQSQVYSSSPINKQNAPIEQRPASTVAANQSPSNHPQVSTSPGIKSNSPIVAPSGLSSHQSASPNGAATNSALKPQSQEFGGQSTPAAVQPPESQPVKPLVAPATNSSLADDSSLENQSSYNKTLANSRPLVKSPVQQPQSTTGASTSPTPSSYSSGLTKPRYGLSKPPSFQKTGSPALSRPAYSGPGSRGTGSLPRPPQFLSNKPPAAQPQNSEPSTGDKRPLDQNGDKVNENSPSKVIKIE